MAHLALAISIAVILGLQWSIEAGPLNSEQQQHQEYVLSKRSLQIPLYDDDIDEQQQQQQQRLQDGRGRRSSGMGSSFIRYGRNNNNGGGVAGKVLEAVSQPHTRSDIIIRYGRDELKNRLARLRQERMQRLARIALVCANKSMEDDQVPSSAEERIIRDMCRDAPLHPTVPDFV